MCRIKRARRLPVLKCAKSVTMRRERLMRRVGVILPDLVVPGRLSMKPRRVSMMCRSRSMVPSCGLTGGHGDPLPQLVRSPATYPRSDRCPKARKSLRPPRAPARVIEMDWLTVPVVKANGDRIVVATTRWRKAHRCRSCVGNDERNNRLAFGLDIPPDRVRDSVIEATAAMPAVAAAARGIALPRASGASQSNPNRRGVVEGVKRPMR